MGGKDIWIYRGKDRWMEIPLEVRTDERTEGKISTAFYRTLPLQVHYLKNEVLCHGLAPE